MMKRAIRMSLTASLLLAGAAIADENSIPNYEGRLLRRHEEQSRKSRSDELRFERARLRAQERMAREERYERMGYSPLRPQTPLWALSRGTFGGPYAVWGY
jgi:hypothetical protein